MIILTTSEKRGLLFIAVVLLVAFLVEWMRPGSMQNDLYDYTLSDSLFDVLSSDTLNIEFSGKPAKNDGIKNEPVTRAFAQKIDINHASDTELTRLPGIGPKTAAKIVAYRHQNGLFRKVDDLIKVDRIGPKTLKKLKPYLTVSR